MTLRVISWIDEGYREGAKRSNSAMGLLLAAIGLVALGIDNAAVRVFAIALAVLVFALFGWRMLVVFREMAIAQDLRKKTNG
ncbi:hypothetical protein [uncultured Sphingopyxis sp.]|uniref:hypothetical protein n=1 Tax=uncultured Sphingopyxis sp. TaxID=310581 RepID=UPI0025EC9269|nr:hypothetical protein [uncultured Sphingopyxis sp.]